MRKKEEGKQRKGKGGEGKGEEGRREKGVQEGRREKGVHIRSLIPGRNCISKCQCIQKESASFSPPFFSAFF